MKYIDNIKESLARILIFIMVFMQVIGNGSIIPVFAEAFTRENENDNIASASDAIQNGKVSLRNLEQEDLELMIKSESSRYESGDMLYLDVYLKNNSSNEITDGVLKFSGKGLIKEDGYFEDYQDSYSDMGPGSSGKEDEESENESEEVWTVSEDGKLSNIVLKPNSIYHVGFYCTVDDIEDMKSSDVSFTFRGKQDKKKIYTSEKFEYTIGGMNLLPVELDDELEVDREYTMTLDFDLGSKFEEIIDDKMLEDEVEKEDSDTETESEKESEVENEVESTEGIEDEVSESKENTVGSLEEKEEGTIEDEIESSEEDEVKTEDDIESESETEGENKSELSLEKMERNVVKSNLNDEYAEKEIEEIEKIDEVKETESIKETDKSIEDNEVEKDEKVGNDDIEESIKETGSKIENETNSDNTNNIDKDDVEINLASSSNLKDSNATSVNDSKTSKKDEEEKEDKIATPSNAYVKWDTDDINKGEKPVIKDIKCEVDTYGIDLDDFEVVNDDSDLNTKLHVKFKVKDDQEPGIYFGKVEATYKYKNKTYKTNQGFMLNVLGEVIDWDEEITLVGYLGDMEVTVSGPRRSFPIADNLELSVSEVETEKQELVDNILNEKQEELGMGVSGVKALDIKVLADGEYQELNGDVKVNFKNLSLQGGLRELRF